jgi:hypothetical protein
VKAQKEDSSRTHQSPTAVDPFVAIAISPAVIRIVEVEDILAATIATLKGENR